MIDGEPAAGVFILLHPVEAKGEPVERPSATTEPDGSFKLTTRAAYDGAPAGEYTVTLLYEPLTSPLMRKKQKPPRIPGPYLRPESSPLRVKVEPKPGNELPPFDVR